MSGKRSRNKGHSFERKIAQELRKIFPEVGRQLEFQKDCAKGIDLRGTGCFKFQCKKLKRYAPITAIFEVDCEEELGDIPILVTAGDFQRSMAVLPFEYLVELIACWEKKYDR